MLSIVANVVCDILVSGFLSSLCACHVSNTGNPVSLPEVSASPLPSSSKTQGDAAPESLQLKDSSEEQGLPSGVPWPPGTVCAIGRVHFSGRGYGSYIRFQVGHVTKKGEESLTGALLASFISFPPLALLCLSDSLKFPSSHRRLPHTFHRLPSLHYWPSWMSRLHPCCWVSHLILLTLLFWRWFVPTRFHPSPHLLFGLRGHSPWPCNISPWPSEFQPSPGPFLLPSLLFRFVLLSSAAKWRFSTIFCCQAHCLSIFFSLATSPGPMYVRLPHPLELRSVFINAVSTGMPDNTCTISARKFILLSGSSSFFFFFLNFKHYKM